MASSTEHVTDEDLARIDEDAGEANDGTRVRAHLRTCEACRRRSDEASRLRELLAQAGNRERRAMRDTVPGAMMRLRLRRNGVTSANEFLEGFVAFMRGLASLFSVPPREEPRDARTRRTRDDSHG